METNNHKIILSEIAEKAMKERGFNTVFPELVMSQVNQINIEAIKSNNNLRDLRNLIWCSIDNEESRDLDQLSYGELLENNRIKIYVAVADVDALVNSGSDADIHASQNTVTVYTTARIFPLFPERLSTDLTSLNQDEDRASIVVEMIVEEDGNVSGSDIYCALVHNYAKLDYDKVAAWMDGKIPMLKEIENVKGLAENILLQEKAAQRLRQMRYTRGALDFETIESRPVFIGESLGEMKASKKNRAKNMIEDFMIACNVITAQFLADKNLPSLRRVVSKPRRWDRIIQLAAEHDFELSAEPDPKSLSECMKFIRQNLPGHYSDFSFSVLKLLGGGEYIMEYPGQVPQGHFGLAVKNYSHSTAPNRRYSDLITHRLLKVAMNGGKIGYTNAEMEAIAKNCTVKEDTAKKVERQVEKSAHAILMESRIGEVFDAIISGAAPKGTWIKLFEPNLEGKLVKGFENLEVGHKIKARLLSVDIMTGFIDFERVS
ncbi:MAG: RNB domain-containing ribonuclease [Bacteroidales bacterium]